METKYCPKCDKDMPLSDFHRDKTQKDGLSRWCKQCKKQNDKKWLDANKEKNKQRCDKYYDTVVRPKTRKGIYNKPDTLPREQ